MAAISQASNKFLFFFSSSSSSSTSPFSRSCIPTVKATINEPKILIAPFPPKHSTNSKIGHQTAVKDTKTTPEDTISDDPLVIAKLYAIMEAIADRVEMHKNIGVQRDNWNHLLLTSINTITLTAAAMCGLSATASGDAAAALKFSSTVLYLAAVGMLAIMNSIQPSQLAEEQRNASRLFKKLYLQIQTLVSIGNPEFSDVNEAIENVLALDRAFPLPLLGAMLERFPSSVQPAIWWPEKTKKKKKQERILKIVDGNGWNREIEDEMREIVRVLKRKDKAEYLRLGEKTLKLHRIFAVAGPVLTAIAAIGSGIEKNHPWAALIGVGGGAMASIVNAIEHGGQVGMVFEMYRCNAGFFELMVERIESNVEEEDAERRENGEIFEMKIGLQLGRNLSELKNFADPSSSSSLINDEFASKLF